MRKSWTSWLAQTPDEPCSSQHGAPPAEELEIPNIHRAFRAPSIFDIDPTAASVRESVGAAPDDTLENEPSIWHSSSGELQHDDDAGCLDERAADFEQLTPPLAGSVSFGPLQVGVVLVLLVALVGSLKYVTKAEIVIWSRWVAAHRVRGCIAFIIVYSACLVLMLPAAALSLLGGALFGLYGGVLVVWSGNLLGQTLAFLLARWIFRDAVRSQLERRWKKFYLIDAAVQSSGWKVVVVLRLSPIVPHVITNYVLGVTKLSLWTYSWSSAVSVLPYVVIFVYVGCLTKNVLEIMDGSWARSDAFLPWGIVSALVVCVMLFYGYRFVRKLMRDAFVDTVAFEEAGTRSSSGADLSHVAVVPSAALQQRV